MADLGERNYLNKDLQDQSRSSLEGIEEINDYQEETAAEIAQPMSYNRQRVRDNHDSRAAGGGMGLAALALSNLSLIVFPVFFGITGIVLGFIARNRGATSGTWAVAIGVISLFLGMFILPFFR